MEWSIPEDREPITIRNEIEASLVDQILREDGIPHYVKTYHDRAYDGIFQLQNGWGCVEAPPEYRQGIRALLDTIRKRGASAAAPKIAASADSPPET